MRTHLIEFTAHPIEATLLRCRRGRGRRGRFLLQRQMESLMSPVLLRVPWINPIELDAQLEPPHRQVRQLRGPVVANGGPLSVRNARGNPKSRNVRSNHGRTPIALGRTIRQHNTNRLQASVTVSGSHRVPSAVRNHPLKSAAHTSFGA